MPILIKFELVVAPAQIVLLKFLRILTPHFDEGWIYYSQHIIKKLKLTGDAW